MSTYPGSAGTARPPGLARGTVVTIGAYDGVHLGHRAVIREVCRIAAERDLQSAVVTFDRHPASVVRPEFAPKLLTDLPQRLELLASTGVDHVVVVTFDLQRAHEDAEDFVDELVVLLLGARVVVVGEDFHFGRRRRGNVEMLRALGPARGFSVEPLALVGVRDGDGPKVSSTEIRGLLQAGRVAEASTLLGRAHEVRGTVGKGDQRGRELGFPTANVEVASEICLPADGIYAGWYERPDGQRHRAAISLGRRPTFYDDQPVSLLEAYLLEYSGDLYGQPAKVCFVDRLRGERRFDSVDALVEQMRRDVERTRQLLGPDAPSSTPR